MARSCPLARVGRAKILPSAGEERQFCGLCLGNVFGWKLGKEGSLSSDTKMMNVAKGMSSMRI